MLRRLFIGLVPLGLAWPASLPASCLCETVSPGGRAPARELRREVKLIGNALEVAPLSEVDSSHRVLLLVETSWTRPMPDTISLVVGGDSPCARYVAGGRYIVLAVEDTTATGDGPLIAPPCHYAWRPSDVGGRRLR